MALQPLHYSRGSLQLLNQLLIPFQTVYDPINTTEDAWQAIKQMRVRGAPLIATIAMLGLAVELTNGTTAEAKAVVESSAEEAAAFIVKQLDYLVTSRPTAYNLSREAEVQKHGLKADAAGGQKTGKDIVQGFVTRAEDLLSNELAINKRMGDHGADFLESVICSSSSAGLRILTHCNTGSLATAGHGTALGVIRTLHERGKLAHAYCTETRPYNQGARLTAYELVHDKIPGTLITDSMAGALMSQGKVDAVIVGADRVARNGDTANKIGTYSLALIAKAHGVKFLVAAPTSTIDMNTLSGADIKIEERPSNELTSVEGPRIVDGKVEKGGESVRVALAAEGINVWNPAFDVTPASILITGIVTENGVATKGEKGFESSLSKLKGSQNGV